MSIDSLPTIKIDNYQSCINESPGELSLNRLQFYSIIIGCFALIFGYFFYITFRGIDPLHLNILSSSILGIFTDELPHLVQYSLPSFIHVTGLSFISLGLVNFTRRQVLLIPSFWAIANTLYELLQSNLFNGYQILPGTFDMNDILASIFSALFVALLYSKTVFHNNGPALKPLLHLSEKQKKLSFNSIVLFGVVIMLGCGDYTDADPIYLSYPELRSPLVIDDKRQPTTLGKHYAHDNLLLINEKNEGIYLYDNVNNNPTYIKFINIPGNLDMEIKDGYLFADSYVDLLKIDISDLDNIHITKRYEHFFAYNSHQNIPRRIALIDLDRSKGVVVDYKVKD